MGHQLVSHCFLENQHNKLMVKYNSEIQTVAMNHHFLYPKNIAFGYQMYNKIFYSSKRFTIFILYTSVVKKGTKQII